MAPDPEPARGQFHCGTVEARSNSSTPATRGCRSASSSSASPVSAKAFPPATTAARIQAGRLPPAGGPSMAALCASRRCEPNLRWARAAGAILEPLGPACTRFEASSVILSDRDSMPLQAAHARSASLDCGCAALAQIDIKTSNRPVARSLLFPNIGVRAQDFGGGQDQDCHKLSPRR